MYARRDMEQALGRTVDYSGPIAELEKRLEKIDRKLGVEERR